MAYVGQRGLSLIPIQGARKESLGTTLVTSLWRNASLTLSLPRVLKIKTQDESQISFWKILKYK